MLKKVLEDTNKTKIYLNNLPEVYLIGLWAKYGTMSFKFSGKFKYNKKRNEYVPLVYDYYDGNGTCSKYILREIYETTTGFSIGWTFNKKIAEESSENLNRKLKETSMNIR